MIDIGFFMKSYQFRLDAQQGKLKDRDAALAMLESFRQKDPVVYNIETTNACNMKCEMCPRTTMMTRRVTTLSSELFGEIVGQLRPFTQAQWDEWQRFVLQNYGIKNEDMSENHFFLLIIPRVIQLHGYGDPLLDRNMTRHVQLLTERGFHSYFSCNPANIDLSRTEEMFENGLSYVKYSIESVDDIVHKKIRGKASDFSSSYEKILSLLELKTRKKFKTVIVVTMLDLNRKDQREDFAKLREAFKDQDVYIYLKSEDQQWYRKDFHGTCSVHWSEFCKHPWMSMTVKSDGAAAMCMEDFNNEIVLGNVKMESLSQIWNGEKYRKFRREHFELTPGLKCTEQCDMTMIGELVRGEGRSTP
jgi:radical SAM protein with 4Fe4S-binding SPASM domain